MMNAGIGNGVHAAMQGSINIGSQLTSGIMEDDMSEGPSSPESTFDASDLMHSSMADEVTAQLAAAGTHFFFIKCSLLTYRLAQTD